MRAPVERAGGGFVHPVVHGLNPLGTVSGVPLAVASLPGAGEYQGMMEIPMILGELVLEPGMVLAFEPNCAFGRHVANLGGTVVVGDDQPLELNPLTAEVLDATAVAL